MSFEHKITSFTSFPPLQRNFGHFLSLLSLVALLTGCMVGPNYHPPQVSVPPAYHEPFATETNAPIQNLSHWWGLFHDPQLDALIQQAVAANHDLRLAQARVREARAQAGVARSALFPSVDASGDYSRQRFSQHTPNGFLAHAAGQDLEQNLY